MKLRGYCSLCGTESIIESTDAPIDSHWCCHFGASTLIRYRDPVRDPSVWWIASRLELGNLPSELTCGCTTWYSPRPLVFIEVKRDEP